jgi:ssDNA-binding replication factor A large subunit
VQFAGEEVVEAGEFEEEGEFEELRFSVEEFEEGAETHGEGLGGLRVRVWWYDGASGGFGNVGVGGLGR